MATIKCILGTLLLLVLACNTATEVKQQITNVDDYNAFLYTTDRTAIQQTLQNYEFWMHKLEATPNQYPYLVKAAAAQSQLFNQTGAIKHLAKAEELLVKANAETHYKNSAYLRTLARNYITQHKFKAALELLKIAETNGDALYGTQNMLFDVYLELGDREKAKTYLSKIENYDAFDFLIRLSKWSDHEGQLDKAILYLQKATEIAARHRQEGLLQWSYTNSADYYGHAGNISAAYQHYLKALALDPNDAYAKRGIAWIVYAHEKNAEEALRILNAITETYKTPDYHLLKAEIAEFKGAEDLRVKAIAAYKDATNNALYGDMYNAYTIDVLTSKPIHIDSNTETALQLAVKEVANRPTALSYDLLAWTHHVKGDTATALHIMENHVAGHTSEPKAVYHMAEIYKANGALEKAKALKQELLESTFELGPLMAENIKRI